MDLKRRSLHHAALLLAFLIGLMALLSVIPAQAVTSTQITAVCDHATVTLTDYPAGTYADVYTKRRGLNYSLRAHVVVDANGAASVTVATARATSYQTDQFVSVTVFPAGQYAGVSTTGKPFDRCSAYAAAKPGPTAQTLKYAIDADGTVIPLNVASKTLEATAQTCTPKPDGKCYWYNEGRFLDRSICFQNNLGTYWNYQQAQAGFTSGSQTVLFYNHGASTNTPTSCAASGWVYWQILGYAAYTANDGHCAYFEATLDANGFYNANTTIRMNASPNRPPTCGDTLQHRNNTVSVAIGVILGLDTFNSSTNLTAAVMNYHFSGTYNFPGVDDRNALYWLY